MILFASSHCKTDQVPETQEYTITMLHNVNLATNWARNDKIRPVSINSSELWIWIVLDFLL